MNIERLAEIAQAVVAEFQVTGVIKRIQAINSALDQVMQQPSEEHENALNDQLNAFNKSMNQSTLTRFPATWRPYVEELEIMDILGEPLRRRVEDAVSGRGVVQAKAKEGLQAVLTELGEYQEKFQQLINAAEKFDFKARHVEDDMAEVSFLFPSDQFGGRMADFAKDVKLMDEAVGFFSELGTGSREEPKMYQLSNPDPLIIAGVSVGAATTLMIFVKAVLDVIESTYSLQEAREKLRAAKASKRTIEAIEEDIQEKIDNGVLEARGLLFERYKPAESRKAELDNLADKVLPKLVDRIDRGYKIDANAEVPPEPEGDGQSDTKEAAEGRRVASELVEISRQIRYRESPDRPVLQLAPPEDEETESGESD